MWFFWKELILRYLDWWLDWWYGKVCDWIDCGLFLVDDGIDGILWKFLVAFGSTKVLCLLWIMRMSGGNSGHLDVPGVLDGR
jgi:hypothetical protein